MMEDVIQQDEEKPELNNIDQQENKRDDPLHAAIVNLYIKINSNSDDVSIKF